MEAPDLYVPCGVSAAITLLALRSGSLSVSGALAAFVVGVITTLHSAAYFTVLLWVFVSSSAITKVGKARKSKLLSDYKPSSGRRAVQVLSNGAFPTAVAALGLLGRFGVVRDHIVPVPHTLDFAFVTGYAFLCGDTWASELGIISPRAPRLITTLQRVPPGTNGGLTMLGLLASAVGGGSVGYIFALLSGQSIRHWGSIGLAGGFVGSLVDSLLGATVQATMYDVNKGMVCDGDKIPSSSMHVSGRNWLDNHEVNFAASIITGIVLPLAWQYLD